MGIEWKDYKGKRVMCADFRGCQSESDMLNQLDEVSRLVSAAATRLLLLSNFEGTSASPKFMERSKQAGKEVLSFKVKKHAVVGISGLKIILFQAFLKFTGDKNTQAFSTETQALEWLVQ
jgi:hypothetical protein